MRDVRRRSRLAQVGAGATLALSGMLLVGLLVLRNLSAVIILGPALLGGAVALRWPENPLALVGAALLTAATASFLLIGGYGLLFLPPLVLLVVAAAMSYSPTAEPRHGDSGR